MRALASRWRKACEHLGVDTNQDVFTNLVEQYSQHHRYYHSLQHLQECFYYFDLIKKHASSPIIIEMALWFHDAIYDVKSKDNEQLSADWANECLQIMKVKTEDIKKIKQLILVTSHHIKPNTIDEKIITDVDLAILGADRRRFIEYEQQIRKEYSWVPYFLYKKKRRMILMSFLERPTIYHSIELFQLLEKKAQINLQEAIS